MPIFTAVAAAVSAAVGGGIFGAVAGFAARTLLTVGITKLISNRSNSSASGTADAGSRVQLPPATNNKLPVVYGKAYMAPIITDAKISEDQKTMWYVCTLAEVTDTGSYTFGDIYWGGKKVVFDGTDTAKVVQLETNGDPVQIDDKVNGKIYIYKFPNGSSSGISTGGSNAITLLSDTSIPADLRWNSALYTDGGQSASMTNTAFLIVKVIYDTNAGTTNLATMNVELTNSLTKPNEVIYDYMTNTRYGCAILPANVDTASLTVLGDYSDELITYVPVGGGTATQARYRINGPINTGQNCLSNLQSLVDACDSWLQYSELTGDWTIVVNKPYDWDGTVITDLFLVDDSILISGINVNPIDLNNSYNVLEVQYPNTNINDQTDYNVINLIDYVPDVMSYNEPPNQLTVQFPVVNDYIQSTYLGIRRLLQSREDLTIDCTLDYSGIQIQAGDVIRVKFDYYGWDTPTFPDGKLFRVSQVQEAKLDDGSLGARITAFEYNGTVYYDDPINDFVPASNTGLSDPNIIGTPIAPTVVLQDSGTVNSMFVTGTVPSTGQVIYMDFNVGTSSNSATHSYYTTVSASNGLPYAAGATVSINSTDLEANTYYWSITAKNQMVGVRGPSSTSTVWAGPSVSQWNGTDGGITNNNIANTTITGSKIASNTITANKLADSGVTSGSYTNPTLTVDSKGLITVAANGTPGIAGIAVQEEGTTVVNVANTINFVGSTVTVSNVSNVATITVTSGGGSTYAYVSDRSFNYTNGGVNPPETIAQKSSYGAARIPGARQANASTGSFETYTFDSYYPWYTGNSLTTNGYLSNSGSGRMNPDGAAIQNISSPDSMGGRAGWWTLIGAAIDTGNRIANVQFNNTSTIQVIADADCTFQVAGWYKTQEIANGANISSALKLDSTIGTYELLANKPQNITLSWNIDANATFAIYDMGMAGRAVTNGSNVIVLFGTSLTSKPSGWDYSGIYFLT